LAGHSEFVICQHETQEESTQMPRMVNVTACFRAAPGSDRDKECHDIFKRNGGVFVGSGTSLETGDRDVEFEIPKENLAAVREALRNANFEIIDSEGV
jgi:hypothetical protein